jgi:hypothetical protein
VILLSVEAKDDISEVDPVLIYVDYDIGTCWLEVTRCGVRMMTGSAHWEGGRWWKRTAENVGEVLVSKTTPSTSDEIAELIFVELSSRAEVGGRADKDMIRAALDERRMGPIALALEVLAS